MCLAVSVWMNLDVYGCVCMCVYVYGCGVHLRYRYAYNYILDVFVHTYILYIHLLDVFVHPYILYIVQTSIRCICPSIHPYYTLYIHLLDVFVHTYILYNSNQKYILCLLYIHLLDVFVHPSIHIIHCIDINQMYLYIHTCQCTDISQPSRYSIQLFLPATHLIK